MAFISKPLKVCCLFGLLLLLFSFEASDAVDANCDFLQKLELGKTYFITNPNYPNNYTASRSCRWHATSDTRVRITCNEFNIPASPNCEADTFNVYTDPVSGPRRYCGSGDFSRDSTGKEMIITLTSANNSRGGTFRCFFEAIEEEECRCGWKKPTKIVGGRETGINEYPMMAGIINVPIQQVYCGGTIISPKHILTAAHCLNKLAVNDLGILVGDHDLTTGSETNATKLYRAASYVIHPSYVSNKKDYDIAVITIAGTITYTNEVGPACLPFQHYLDSFGGSFVDVLGWGTTEFAGAPSNTLQKVRLSITNFLSCKSYFQNLEYRQICTYAEGKDACQFDSGGPVLWQNPTTRRLVLVGIISYGSFCASEEPAVNTRVGSFVDWITSVTTGASYCQNE
ncbi:serine protease homolog 42 isoform 2 precursor [Nasonia vitripennis]|uniref:Venom serine protease 34 n=2 Tax=Nasonia vitripennis TaxID=7425 RepID=A0A7M6UFS9_NASVI|nr:serine protease homolog 42 isoform 2 precursor [Nasonia vitripennis]